MADLIDPDKLVSVAQVAREYGYHPTYLAQLAVQKKFRAWRIGKTWATTREIIEKYKRTTPPPGRPKDTQIPRTKSGKKTN